VGFHLVCIEKFGPQGGLTLRTRSVMNTCAPEKLYILPLGGGGTRFVDQREGPLSRGAEPVYAFR